MYVVTEKDTGVIALISQDMSTNADGVRVFNGGTLAIGFPCNVSEDVTIPDGVEPQKYTYINGVFAKSAAYPWPDLDTLRTTKLAELDAAAQAAIVSGCDVTLSDGTTGHISLTAEDQINLSTAQASVQAGAAGYPYHLDGQLCKIYTAADILSMSRDAVQYILYHTTYCNHLRAWARRADTAAELEGITYGAVLPDDLKTNMEAIINAASA